MDILKILIYLFSGFMMFSAVGAFIASSPIVGLFTLALAAIAFIQARNRNKEN